ncbi:hypothetical protein [Hymenobacter cellulosilyticus]|uniref:STAS/SEC14 domain-containing protein n=1 Tax=Hymenobacter cellulosilyticus TaxID=2932248 RepID=A0A8T9Q1A4_9BACT|nr:hypothetical protein [Hymenobacter cellulosilyticus]UOQ70805.1 hypothetical protein MUN79_19220 [Hymenobacter cellulosilyticus]
MADLLYPANASLYYHNELATVVEHAHGYARIDWNPVPITSASLRAVYEQVLALLLSRRLCKVLTDHQMMPPLLPTEQQWLVETWAPRAIQEAGYRYCAIVQAYDVLNQQSTRQIVQRLTEKPLTVRYFEDDQAAEDWLCDTDTPCHSGGQVA